MSYCSNCGEKINEIKFCPSCGQENIINVDSEKISISKTQEESDFKDIDSFKKPFYKKWWGILIIVIFVLGIIQGIFTAKLDPCKCVEIYEEWDSKGGAFYKYHSDQLMSQLNRCLDKYDGANNYRRLCYSSKTTKKTTSKKKNIKPFERPGGDEFKLSEKPTINELFSFCGTKFEESFMRKGYKLSKVYYPEKNATQYFGDFYNGRERVLKNSHYTRYYYFELQKEINGIYSILAPSGLNYRKSANVKSEILGKFPFQEKVRLLEKTNKIFEVDDYDSLGNFNKKIKGNWVKVISVLPNKEGFYNSGYVFDGYLKKSKGYTSETNTYKAIVDLTDCSVSEISESNHIFSH